MKQQFVVQTTQSLTQCKHPEEESLGLATAKTTKDRTGHTSAPHYLWERGHRGKRENASIEAKLGCRGGTFGSVKTCPQKGSCH